LGCHAFALIRTASVARMWHPVAHRKALSEQPQQSQGVGVTLNELLLPELFLPDQLSPSPSFHPVPVRLPASSLMAPPLLPFPLSRCVPAPQAVQRCSPWSSVNPRPVPPFQSEVAIRGAWQLSPTSIGAY